MEEPLVRYFAEVPSLSAAGRGKEGEAIRKK